MSLLHSSHQLVRGDVALVFGMEWFPLIGDHLESQARRLARCRRARHFALASGAAAAVGILHGRLQREGRRRHYSAAAAFASLHPSGTVAAVLSFAEGVNWLIAVHEGAVMTRTDQFYADSVLLHEALVALREAHPGLALHEGPADSSNLLDALFDTAHRQQGGIRTLGAVSSAGWAGMAVCVLVGVATVRLIGFDSPDAVETPVVPDPRAAWRAAVHESARRHRVHGVAGLQGLLDAIHAVPARLGGWRLEHIECRPETVRWACHSRYRREPGSDNLDFLTMADPAWQVSFDPLEGATAIWSAPLVALPLDAAGVRSPHQNEAWFVSALQAMLPAFRELRLEAPQLLPVRPPLDAQQRPLPRPADMGGFRRRALRVQAPLRSLALLLPQAAHLSWERVQLAFAPVESPTLLHSSLQATLSGVLYETDLPASAVMRPAHAGSPS